MDHFEGCLLDLPAYNSDDPCSPHDLWLDIKNHIHNIFYEHTLAQLIKLVKSVTANEEPLPSVEGNGSF